MAQNTIVATTPLGDALRKVADLADQTRIGDAMTHPDTTGFQVTVRTSEDVHRFASRTGAAVKTWENDNTWFTYAEAFGPISFAVVSLEPIPRELRRPADATDRIEGQAV